jgi:hypothetical protein
MRTTLLKITYREITPEIIMDSAELILNEDETRQRDAFKAVAECHTRNMALTFGKVRSV